MRLVLFIILFAMTANVSFAESIKERLKRARAEEAEQSMAPPVVNAVEPALPPAVEEMQTSTSSCRNDAIVKDKISYYYECHCKTLRYPVAEALLKRHGMVLATQGVKELSDGITHYDPKDRAQQRYACGFSIDWEPNNKFEFPDVDACYAFIKKVEESMKASKEDFWWITRPLYYGCGARIRKP